MSDPLLPFRDAPVAVLAYVARSGAPMACAVTPYVVAQRPVVTSTLALLAKARAVRADGRAALLAGEVVVEGPARVGIDPSPAWFDRNLRAEELRKYPPAASVLSVPGHRRLFAWYVGRAVITIDADPVTVAAGAGGVAIAVVDHDGRLTLRPLPVEVPAEPTATVPLGTEVPDGPAVLLEHCESTDMKQLRQRTLHGTVRDGRLAVERQARHDIDGRGGTLAQLRTAHELAARARKARGSYADWPAPPVG